MAQLRSDLFILRCWSLRFSQKFLRRKHVLSRNHQTYQNLFKYMDMPTMISRPRVSANAIVFDGGFTG